MKLKVYADRMSQPSRAVIIFCKANGIDFEEIKVELSKRQQLSPEFEAINPLKKVPAIVDGRFKLFESHAILIYLASAFPGVPDHWYPADLSRRAKINSVLSWHHLNLRRGAATFALNAVLAPFVGLPLNQQAAAEAEKILSSSLSKLENVWLKGNGPFLLGGFQPSIADLSLVCEIMQLELLDEKDHDRILGPHKKVQTWIKSTRNATRPHFDEVHNVLHKLKTKIAVQQPNRAGSETQFRAPFVGLPLNQQAAAEAEKILSSSLSKFQNVWPKGNGPFSLGGFQPSIANLSPLAKLCNYSFWMRRMVIIYLVWTGKFRLGLTAPEMHLRPHFDEEVHN